MRKKLLIIDDNLNLVGLLIDGLADLFEVVETAYAIEDACKLLSENTFSVIILDINLNNRNGAEIVRFINDSEANSNKTAPIIILSGIVTPQFIEQYKNKFAAIFAKPFNNTILRETVSGILSTLKEEAPVEQNQDDIPEFKYAGPFAVDALKEQVDQVMVAVKKNAKLKQLFKQAKIDRGADKYILTHIDMIINISAAICTRMEWNSDKTLEKFVYAAYLHDMALSNRPDLARINTFEKLEVLKDTMSEDEYKAIFDHPNAAANYVKDVNEIPPDVEMIIRQHHELPNQTGFPSRAGAMKITPFSAVFIVAHNLADYIIENPKWTMEEFVKKFKSRLHGSHFTKIMREIQDLK